MDKQIHIDESQLTRRKETSGFLPRRAFTPKETGIASTTGFVRTVDRFYRPRIKAYPVDDHEPTKPTDRDDAIYAEALADGTFCLHVTIADVAAHIAKDSILDKAAAARVFTIYRPPARDPMFPFILSEDRFSLEHEQQRLGMTISIYLDANFRTTNIRFVRTIIESECLDYATAYARMRREGDDFATLALVARGIKDSSKPPIETYTAGDTAYIDKSGLLRLADAHAMASAKLVQITMIFANNEIAKFFNQTGLPFLFRNHQLSSEKNARAEYEPYDKGHYALRLEGLIGAYSHCTSPIRRYADLVNQRMMHYIIDVLESIAGEMLGFLPQGDKRRKDDLMPVIWHYASALMGAIFSVQQTGGGSARQDLQEMLERLLYTFNPEAGAELFLHANPSAQLLEAALRLPLPYTHEELANLTPHLNKAGKAENEAVAELNRRNLEKWRQRVEEDFASGNFEALSTQAFSGVLRRAGVTGKITEAFMIEAMKRIQHQSYDAVQDSYSVLLLNKEYQNPWWRALKRAALNHVERDPMIINNLFEKAMKDGEIHADSYIAESMLRDSATEKSLPLMHIAGIAQHVEAALVVTYMPELANREYAAAEYSVGYSRKDAARHAKFNFIRALAFGELGPLDQTILPTPLYAELSHDRSRADILQEMVDSMRLTMRELGPRKRPDGKLSFAYQIYGNGIEHSLLGFVVADTLEQAREKAATRILRTMQFKRAYATQNPEEIGFPSHPAHVIRELAQLRGWQLCEPQRTDIRETERGIFRASIKLTLNDGEYLTSTCEARNKDNALLYCFEHLREKLQERGLLRNNEQNAIHSKWVTWSASARESEVE